MHMVRALLVVVAVLRRAWLVEAVGACLIVVGVFEAWGSAAAYGAAGVGLVLKAFEIEARQ